MNKSNNTLLFTFTLLVLFAGGSIGSGLILYVVIGYSDFETKQFEYLNGGMFPLILGFIAAFFADRKYKYLRCHLLER